MYVTSELHAAQLKNVFTYHPPRPDQIPRYEQIREEARKLAMLLTTVCPNSRELSIALTHLEQMSFFANAAIARNESTPLPADESPTPGHPVYSHPDCVFHYCPSPEVCMPVGCIQKPKVG